MSQRIAVGGYTIAGMLFLIAGLLPALRGESRNVVFFVLGIVFLILAITTGMPARRQRSGPD